MQVRRTLEIDGLRAIAVIAVIATHFSNYFPNGYVGVDIFFVISGFVITGSLLSISGQSGRRFFAEFFSRRMKRLLPALVVMILVVSLFISFVDPSPSQHLRTSFYALLGLSNVYFYLKAFDYFADVLALNPFTHTWSLGVEEQFYMVFPFVVYLAKAWERRTVVLVGTSVCFTSYAVWTLYPDSNATFYLVFARAWQLLLGVGAYLVSYETNIIVEKAKRLQINSSTFMMNCLFLGMLFVLFLPSSIPIKLLSPLVCFVAVCILVFTSQHPLEVLRSPPTVFVGKISYSLYLWHWPIVVILAWTFGNSFIPSLVGLIICFLLAVMSYHYVENPLRYRKWANREWKEILLAVSVGLSCAFLVRTWSLDTGGALYLGQRPIMIAQGTESLTTPYFSEYGAKWVGEDCVLSSNSELGTSIKKNDCGVGESEINGKTKLLVVGNSLSVSLLAGFDIKNVTAIVTSSWGASAAPDLVNTSAFDLANNYYWKTVFPKLLNEIGDVDVVIIAADLSSLSPKNASTESSMNLQVLDSSLRKLANDLRKNGTKLGMISPLPFARDANCEPAAAIPQWFAIGGSRCKFYSYEYTMRRQKSLNEVLKKLEVDGTLFLIDLMPIFCPLATCSYIGSSGEMLYRDHYAHPSVEAAKISKGEIERVLQKNLNINRP